MKEERGRIEEKATTVASLGQGGKQTTKFKEGYETGRLKVKTDGANTFKTI